ncbi:MAG: tail fiber domain-containing protein [Bacteroidota bacterium]
MIKRITTYSNALLYLLVFTFLTTEYATAQVGINATDAEPDASAMLDVSSTDKGVLIPRMDSTSRNNIASPAIGLIVYDSTTTSFWYYDNDQWNEIRNGTQPLTINDITENLDLQYDYSCIETASTLMMTNEPIDIAVSGNYAYVITDGDELKVIDISTPTAPTVVGTLALGAEPIGIAVSGNYAYIIDNTDDDLRVIDISTPAAPTQLGSNFSLGNEPRDITIAGDYAYIAEFGSGNLNIINISNPASLAQSGSVNVGLTAYSVSISGNYAYVIYTISADLQVVDVSDVTNPTLSGSTTIGNEQKAITASGDYVYTVDQFDDELNITDISNAASPTAYASLSIGDAPSGITLSGNYAFIVDETDNDLRIIDISIPAAPILSDQINLEGSANAIAVANNYGYVVHSNGFSVIALIPCYMNVGINPITGEFVVETANLSNHIANQNIELSGYYLSNDGDDEGISIDDDGKVTFSNNLILNGNYLSNDGGNEGISISDDGNVTFHKNILLDDNYLSNDGGNEGISIADNGTVTTSSTLSVNGNIALNSNYLSNDGDNEGISIDNDGNATFSNNLTINGNLTLSDTINGSNDTVYVNDVLVVKDDLIIEQAKTGSNAYIATFKNTTNDNAARNDGINIIAGHDNFSNTAISHLINFSTPNGTTIGAIQQDAATSVLYNTTSDIRLKTNIQPTQYGLADILKIQVRDYHYKKDLSQTPQTGFLAQQLYEIYPSVVSVGGDDETTNPWMVDYAKVTPLLVKGMQNQQSIIEELTTSNTQLKTKHQQQATEINALKAQTESDKLKIQALQRQVAALQVLQQQHAEMKATLEQIQKELDNQ